MKAKNTKTFAFTNPHPKGSVKVGDCVYRALSIATGKDWLIIYDELTALGRELLAPPNDKLVYAHYLDQIADRKDVIIGGKRVTADNLARLQQQSTESQEAVFVIRTAGHLATVKGGKLRDTWDSGSKAGYVIWELR
jgi:hypothetical protein